VVIGIAGFRHGMRPGSAKTYAKKRTSTDFAFAKFQVKKMMQDQAMTPNSTRVFPPQHF
jgi:hypothetical protein